MPRGYRSYLMPDEIWDRLKLFLPVEPGSPKGGRRRKDPRKIAEGIFYQLKTGCQWKAIPRYFGTGSTLHRYFQKWVAAGVFEKVWQLSVHEYDYLEGIDWNHLSIDTSSVQAPLGGKKNRSEPDRQRQTRYEKESAC